MEQLNSNLTEKNEMCEKHGVYVSKNMPLAFGRSIWTKCCKCTEEEDAARKKAEKEMKLAREKAYFQDQLNRSWLPKRFIGKTFDNFICSIPKQERALFLAKDYADNFQSYADEGKGLILFGGVGAGKSHVAAAIIQDIMKFNRLGLYVTVSELIRMVRDTWRRDAETSELQAINKFIYADLLVLDEVGKQYGTEGEENILFDVLDGRYREQMPVILMGNISTEPKVRPDRDSRKMNDLEYYLGERCADRLRETNKAISFDWGSYRGRHE